MPSKNVLFGAEQIEHQAVVEPNGAASLRPRVVWIKTCGLYIQGAHSTERRARDGIAGGRDIDAS
jgi:hypothetical protein